MKRVKLINVFSWALTHISWLTMVFSPVAYGEQSKKISAENLKIYAKEFGLNQKTTLGEFWEKTKYYYPGYMYNAIETFVQKNPNVLMPQIQIQTSKSSDGQDIPVISFTQNGKTQTVQIFGESDKFVKMNGVVLNESETKFPQKMFAKMMAADPKLAADYKSKSANETKKTSLDRKRPFKDYSGLPRFNKKSWEAMNIRERVSYIVEMRLLNEKAENVLRLKQIELQKNKKTSAFEYLKKYEAAWAFLIGESAEAYTGEHCINQGFVASSSSAYNKESFNYRTNKKGAPLQVEACNLKSILASEKYTSKSKANDYVRKAIDSCQSQGLMPCNPMVYSFKSDGSAFCSDPQNSSTYQQGTHFKGSCDSQARLSSGFIDGSKQGLKSESEQGLGGNKGKSLVGLKHDEIKKLIEADQAQTSFEATENYLKGMLKADGGKDSLLNQLNNKEWSKELEDELLKIQAGFEDNITKSMNSCAADLNDSKQTHESNYRDACEQLHRRWLFSHKIIEKLKCKDGQDKGEKVCMDKPKPAPVVQPSVDCPKPPAPVVAEPVPAEPIFPTKPKPEICVAPDEPVPVDASCETKFPGATGYDSKTCICEKSKAEPTVKEQSWWGKLTHAKQSDTKEYECAGGINWWLIGGLAIGAIALWAFFGRNKGPKAPANVAPVPCPPNKTLVNGVCQTPGGGGPVNPPPAPGHCNSNQSGTYPNCIDNPPVTCGAGTVGTYPNCTTPVIPCPAGQTGTFPNCVTPPPVCSGGQTLINGSCGCSNASSCIGNLNSTTCQCTEGGNGGGSGGGSGGVPPKTKTSK